MPKITTLDRIAAAKIIEEANKKQFDELIEYDDEVYNNWMTSRTSLFNLLTQFVNELMSTENKYEVISKNGR